MGPKMLILRRDEGLLHHIGNRRIWHEDAALGRKLRDQPSVAGVDAAHDRWLIIAQPIDVGQVGAEALPREIAARAADRRHQQEDAEQSAQHAARETAEPAAAWLARRQWLPPVASAIVGGGWRQSFAACKGFVHK